MTSTRALCAAALCTSTWLAGSVHAEPAWPLWSAYREAFISKDGRVIDHGAADATTSEGQSYAMFFALAGGDRATFDTLLRWTSNNLAGGALGERLPATRWGRRADGSWGILDDNSAADSDLFIGYVLLEAGRLWRDPALDQAGRKLLAEVVRREVRELRGLGPMLLPAPRGFELPDGTVRLNPSYLPLQLLAGIAANGVPGPFRRLRAATLRLLRARATHGFIDDWVGFRPGRGAFADPIAGAVGSYDAIRVYLWAGLLDRRDPLTAAANAAVGGLWREYRRRGDVPERVDTNRRLQDGRAGPVGFLAALLPRAISVDAEAAAMLRAAIEARRHGRLYGDPPAYYDHNLLLFAQGFDEGRYAFGTDGRLRVPWSPAVTRSGRPAARAAVRLGASGRGAAAE